MDAKPKRRWYQFSLRTMFVGMTLACVGLGVTGWWVHRSKEWIRQRQEVLGRDGIGYVSLGERRAPAGLWLLGESACDSLLIVGYSWDEIERIRQLYPEAEIEVISENTVLWPR